MMFATNREFETGAYTVLDRLSEKSQVASDALLTRELLAWGKKKNMFTLAESVGGADFVNSNSCQTKLDKTWIGETKPSTSALAVGVNVYDRSAFTGGLLTYLLIICEANKRKFVHLTWTLARKRILIMYPRMC